MRNISFALTQDQIKKKTKTVTRRLGWWNLKPGERLRAVDKCMGFKKGEHPTTLAIIEVVSSRHRALFKISKKEVVKEGFPEMSPKEFIDFFCKSMNCDPWEDVNRIEFKYV